MTLRSRGNSRSVLSGYFGRAALYLGLLSAGLVGILCISRTAVAQDCINYWINPRTGVRECLDGSQPPSVPSTGILESSPIPPFNVGRTRFEYRHNNAFAALKNDGSVVTWGGVGGDILVAILVRM